MLSFMNSKIWLASLNIDRALRLSNMNLLIYLSRKKELDSLQCMNTSAEGAGGHPVMEAPS